VQRLGWLAGIVVWACKAADTSRSSTQSHTPVAQSAQMHEYLDQLLGPSQPSPPSLVPLPTLPTTTLSPVDIYSRTNRLDQKDGGWDVGGSGAGGMGVESAMQVGEADTKSRIKTLLVGARSHSASGSMSGIGGGGLVLGPSGKVLSGNFGGLPSTDRQIVIDGCNVAWNYNDCHGFSTEGLQLCLEWFLARNFSKVVSFVPKTYIIAPDSNKRPSRSAHAAKTGFYQNRADDIDGLKRLHERGLVQFTPPGGDDDAFIIEFAYQSDGWIVSNDNYREFRKKDMCSEQRDWLLWRKIFYTFIGTRYRMQGFYVIVYAEFLVDMGPFCSVTLYSGARFCTPLSTPGIKNKALM